MYIPDTRNFLTKRVASGVVTGRMILQNYHGALTTLFLCLFPLIVCLRSAKSLQESRPPWVAHRAAMKERFPDGWNPPRKVSRSDMALIRRLHGIDKEHWSTPNLAERFKISPEAIRRILASSWRSQEDMKEEEIIHDLGSQSRADEAPTRNDVQGHSTLQQYHSSPRHYFDHLVSESSSLNQTVAQLKEATPLRDGFKISRNSKTFKWDQHI